MELPYIPVTLLESQMDRDADFFVISFVPNIFPALTL